MRYSPSMALSSADSRAQLDSLRNEFGFYYASLSEVYHFVWLRDSIYMLLGYEALGLKGDESAKQAVRDGVHALYDRILLPFSYKIDWRIVEGAPPDGQEREYLHPRYLPDGSESPDAWGWTQHDSVGILLWGILRFESSLSGVLRNENVDRHLLQKLVWYLEAVDVPNLPDNGIWEEGRTIHLSTLAAVYAGLEALTALEPRESLEHLNDLAMLTAVWPFGAELPFGDDIKHALVERAISNLERPKGLLRYPGDQYETCHAEEAEWPLGFALLGLAFSELGDLDSARGYLAKLEAQAEPGGAIPEARCGHEGCPSHYNTPLGWAQAMHLVLQARCS